MSRLSFPVTSDGLAVPVLVGLDAPAIAALVAAGLPPPAPILVRGLIDTGCYPTALSTSLLRRLNLQSLGQKFTQTAGGQVLVDLYEVSLGITDPAVSGTPMFLQPQLEVMEVAHPLSGGIEVLVGLDVILECRLLLIDVPTRTFTLEF